MFGYHDIPTLPALPRAFGDDSGLGKALRRMAGWQVTAYIHGADPAARTLPCGMGCGATMTMGSPQWHHDHALALQNGGGHEQVAAVCGECNIAKRSLDDAGIVLGRWVATVSEAWAAGAVVPLRGSKVREYMRSMATGETHYVAPLAGADLTRKVAWMVRRWG